MQPEQIEKLKNLITSSQILDSNEKQEWLALLGLMNDKQLLELQKILVSGGFKQKLEPPSGQKFGWNKEGAAEKHVFNPGPLTHIVNLPSVKSQGEELPRKRQAPERSKRPEQVPPQKSNFLTKLKASLNEKELPPGHAEHELELPAHAGAAKQTPPPTGSQFKQPEPTFRRKPPVVPKAPRRPQGQGFVSGSDNKTTPQSIVTKNLNLTLGKGSSALVYSQRGVNKLEYKDEAKKQPETLPPGIQAGDSGVSKASGASENERVFALDTFGRRSEISQTEEAEEGQKSGLDKWPELSSLGGRGSQQKSMEPLVLQTPEQLTKITVSQFDDYTLEEFVVKIKKMVKVYGYHEVVFNLEKSPLYDAYIKTGMKLLSDDVTSGEEALKEAYLDKKGFEDFVDLLRQIQTV